MTGTEQSNVVELPVPQGDWQLRGLSAEQKFALNPLRPDCIDAANRASANFDGHFPGWQLYSRLVRQDVCFDRQLAAWAIGMARMYSRSRKLNPSRIGPVIAREAREPGWIAAAGLDALWYVMGGGFPETAADRAEQYGVRDRTYSKVRNFVACAIRVGLDNFAMEVRYQLAAVERENRLAGRKDFSASCENPWIEGVLLAA